MAMLSVVVPVYKTEKYLVQCIESILSQTVTGIEIILVDDGSPDGSGAICDRYAELHPNIKVVHKANGGLTQARVSGLRVSTGKYFTFVDSDDWIEPNAYEEMLVQAETHGADIVAAGFIRDYGDRTENYSNVLPSGVYRKEKLQKLCEQAVFSIQKMEQGLAPSVWSKIFRRESTLESFLSRTDTINFGEDSLFTYAALFKAQCVVVMNEHFTYHYRIWDSSMTQKYNGKYFDELFLLYDKLMEAAAEISTDLLMESICYDYVFLFANGILQEISSGNKDGFYKKYCSLKRLAKDPRFIRCVGCVDLKQFPHTTAKYLDLMAKGKPGAVLLYHIGCALASRLKKPMKI